MFKLKEKGFTLIELIVVMVIIGILAAIITPRFIDLQSDARQAAVEGITGAVKSAWAVAIAEKRDFPKVTELAEAVHGGTAAEDGIEVEIRGEGAATTITVPTYKGACHEIATGTCTTITGKTPACGVTTLTEDVVTCIGIVS